MPKPDTTLAAFGRNVARLRTERGLSQDKLAENAEIDRTYVSRLERFAALLESEIFCDDEEGVSRFIGGGDCGRCTDSALRVAWRFHGRVYGYFARDNPDARLPGASADGHDFALLRGRFIVDWWANRWATCIDRLVFDLSDAADRAEVCALYGDASRWKRVRVTMP